MQVFNGINGLGDDTSSSGDSGFLSSIISSVGAAASPAVTAEAEAIIVPIIAPYAIGLVLLSFAGLLFGVTAYSNVKRLRKEVGR